MKHSLFASICILLLFTGCFNTTSAQESANKVHSKVTIVNYEGKPQPDIYAYFKDGDDRKFFKSDANGVLTFIVDTTNVDEWTQVLVIDREKSGGYHNFHVYLRDDTVT